MRDPMSGLMTLPRLQMYLRFDPYSHIVSLEIEDSHFTDVRVKFSIALACMLGFDKLNYWQPRLYVASRAVNLNSTNPIFVYNATIVSQIVGDALTPLLDVVAVQGGPGDLVCITNLFWENTFPISKFLYAMIKVTLFGLKRVKLSWLGIWEEWNYLFKFDTVSPSRSFTQDNMRVTYCCNSKAYERYYTWCKLETEVHISAVRRFKEGTI